MIKWIAFLTVGVTVSVLGQTDGSEDSTRIYPLDPITVTATRVEVSRRDVTPSVTVLPGSLVAAESQKSVLSVVGEQVPGVFIQERGILGFGVNTPAGQVTIRGVGGDPNTQVLVLIDGRPQFMGLFGHPLSDSYLSASTERVEVIRGPASLMYGTNAMGGVINIITGGPVRDGLSADAQATYGSFSSSLVNGHAAYKSNMWSGVVSLSRQHTNGHRPESEFTVRSGYARATGTLSNLFTVTVDGSITAFRTSDPGPASAPLTGNWVDILRGYAGLSLENRTASTEGALRIMQNFGDHTIFDGFRSSDNVTVVSLYQTLRPLEGGMLTVGLDYERYGGTAKNVTFGADFGSFHTDEYGVYILVQQALLERMILNGGFRWEHSGLFHDVVLPQAGVAYRASDDLTVRLSAGKGFRSPTIRELYLFPAPTPTLKPEEMWNYEMGLLQTLGSSTSIEVVGFVSEGSRLIQTAGVYPNLTLSNSGSFVHRGVEVSANYLPANHAQLRMSYSFLDPANETRSVPKHKLFLGADYQFSRFTVHGGIVYVNTIFGEDKARNPLPDYTLIGGRLSMHIASNFSVFLGAENLLNQAYQTIRDYPMPGRTWLMGVRVNY